MDKKSINFRRLAEKRVTTLIKHIRLISNLANRKNYSFSESEVSQMFKAIEKELETAKKKFASYSSDDFGVFRFK